MMEQDSRMGRSFVVRDNGIEHTLVLQPIKPSGYVIMRDDKVAYMGMVWTYTMAAEHIEQLKHSFQSRAQTRGPKLYGWYESTYVVEPIIPIEPPEGTIKAMINNEGKMIHIVDPKDQPHKFEPVICGGYYCMVCDALEHNPIHIRKEPSMCNYPMLPVRYQPPHERRAVETDLDVIVMAGAPVPDEGSSDERTDNSIVD